MGEIMKESTCCFTGHRKIMEENLEWLEERLYEEIENLILSGVLSFKCGGALGFDTMAAQTVLKLKEKYPYISLHLILPCRGQELFWPLESQKLYRDILDKADLTEVLSERYYKGCMQNRNRRLIEGSEVCLCYLEQMAGGTLYTVNYALKKGLRIINLADTQLRFSTGF